MHSYRCPQEDTPQDCLLPQGRHRGGPDLHQAEPGPAPGRDRQDPGEDRQQGEVHQRAAGAAAVVLQGALAAAGHDQGAVQTGRANPAETPAWTSSLR